MRVYMTQPNNVFGRGAFLPLSAGSVWAAAKQRCKDSVILALPLGFSREPVDECTVKIVAHRTNLVGISCYIWNWEYCLALAQAVNKLDPRITVVLGGPHVPNPDRGAVEFLRVSSADILIHGEGEDTFADVCEGVAKRDIMNLPGTTNRAGPNLPRARVASLDNLSSPYLTGVFDDLIADKRYDWHGSQETHRGCPYSCSFCDWGSAVFTKLREFPAERIKAEVEWMAHHQVELLYNCDANYGMLPRDGELIDHLVYTKVKYGYPRKLRAAYPKKHTPAVVDRAVLLAKTGLTRGVTVAMQSLDEDTLVTVKRKNIAFGGFTDLIKMYRERGVPTYTELIVGLPGETYDSFVEGVVKVAEASPDSLNIYPCIVLPNSELADHHYRSTHEIVSRHVRQLLLHATPAKDQHYEYYEMVVSTKTMVFTDWRRAMAFANIMMAFHALGLTHVIARSYSGGLRAFYERLLAASLIWSVYPHLYAVLHAFTLSLEQGLAGEEWGQTVSVAGNVAWPLEERTYLLAVLRGRDFLIDVCKAAGTPYSLIDDQLAQMTLPDAYPDFPTYAREVVWLGRKVGGTKKGSA